MRGMSVAYRWFVEYNPLYFASALCVLAGVFLVARELPPDAFASKLGIAAITEIYQLLLIVGAWLLLRARLRRPAAILGIVALAFLLDVALNGERILSHVGVMSFAPGMRARRAVPASLLLALLGPLKLWVLARVFRLRHAGPALAVAGVAVAALPLLPYAVDLAGPEDAPRQAAHLAVFWLGAPLFGWAFTRAARGWTSPWAEDEGPQEMGRRVAVVMPFLVVALFVVHGVAWSAFPSLALSPAHVAPYVLAGACAWASRLAARSHPRAELVAWVGSAAALFSALGPPPAARLWPVAAVALMTGGAMLALVRVAGLRLILPAVACGFGGAYAFASGVPATLPAPGLAWPASAAVALLLGAAWQRDFRCLFASAVAAGMAIVAVEPAAGLVPFGALMVGLWLAGWSWLLFPELHRWVPFAATASVLALGAAMLWRDPSALAPWYGAAAAASVAAGVALGRREFQAAGLAAAIPMGAATRGHWLPRTGGGWGVALLAAGFVLLSSGVALNLLLARRRARAGMGTPSR